MEGLLYCKNPNNYIIMRVYCIFSLVMLSNILVYLWVKVFTISQIYHPESAFVGEIVALTTAVTLDVGISMEPLQTAARA